MSKETAGGKQGKLCEGKHDESLGTVLQQGKYMKEAMGAGGLQGNRRK